MNAVIGHTLSSGTKFQLCPRCSLKVDDYGFPDPRFYDSKFMKWYYGIPQEDRCKHNKGGAAPPVGEREERYKKALYAALDLIKEALFLREG
jgi:hypothetical protein